MKPPRQPMNPLTFYFSFRSPYAWLAFHRLSRIAGRLPVAIEYVPLIPSQRPEDADPRKTAYLVEDVGRFATAYGLPLQWPKPFATDWKRPHASFLYALDEGRGVKFGLALFAARFCRGENIGEDAVLAKAAEQCGLEPEAVLLSADDGSVQRRVLKGAVRAQRAGLFGVPFFVYRGHRYWGNDRLEWVLRDIAAAYGVGVPDLTDDVFACQFREVGT